MQLIDSHCHIFLQEFDADRNIVVKRAQETGVETLILPNIDSTTISLLKDSCDAFPDACKALLGIHPTSVNDDYKKELKIVEKELERNPNKYIGIGEIGLDLYWDKTYYKEQIDAFLYQLQLAKSMNVPVAIHIRNAFDETFEVLRQSGISSFKGVIHCFSGNSDQAKQAIDFGFTLGIGGIVTFKKSGIDGILSNIDLQHIILETDSPYLAPTPFRGKRNEPSYLKNIAQKVADIKNVSIDDVAKITTNNCKTLFQL